MVWYLGSASATRLLTKVVIAWKSLLGKSRLVRGSALSLYCCHHHQILYQIQYLKGHQRGMAGHCLVCHRLKWVQSHCVALALHVCCGALLRQDCLRGPQLGIWVETTTCIDCDNCRPAAASPSCSVPVIPCMPANELVCGVQEQSVGLLRAILCSGKRAWSV
jgi:hypothetical protein